MDLEVLRTYCLSKPCTTEDMPFDDKTLVFKVGGKMFALTDIFQNPLRINLKCDPDDAQELRATYDAVEPGFHMNKKHWNTVHCGQDLSSKHVRDLIDHSYELVVRKNPKVRKLVEAENNKGNSEL